MKTLITIILITLIGSPNPPPSSTGWMPSFNTSIGIQFSNPPSAGSDFLNVHGSVQNPAILQGFGFSGISKGQKAVVSPFYTANYMITENGIKYQAAVIKVSIEEQYVILSPQKGKNKLKKIAKGDKNAKPQSNGGWMPSWSSLVGVSFNGTPAGGASFSKIRGIVTKPEDFQKLGFPLVKAGEEVAIYQEDPLEIKGRFRALVRIEIEGFYEVFVVEDDGRLSAVTKHLKI